MFSGLYPNKAIIRYYFLGEKTMEKKTREQKKVTMVHSLITFGILVLTL